MICENCKQRHANVTVSQIQNGEKYTHHYCEVCAAQFHPFQYELHEEPMSLQQFISNWFGAPIQPTFQTKQPQQTTSCPQCGFTYRQFLKQGKFGCAQCYSTFYEHLPAIFEKLHGGTEHVVQGAVQPQQVEHEKLLAQVAELRQRMREAIETERFEEAATLRDEIKALEASVEGGLRDEH